MSEPDGSSEQSDPRGTSLTRRGLLAGSSTIALGATGYSDQQVSRPKSGPLSSALLSHSDIVGADSYVEWGIDTAAAPLTEYLRAMVDPFTGDGGSATGFVSSGHPQYPQYIESAVFPTVSDWDEIVTAVGGWLGETHEIEPQGGPRGSTRAAWHVDGSDGFVDAARLERVTDDVAITIVGGDPTAALSPRAAARRYARTVRAGLQQL